MGIKRIYRRHIVIKYSIIFLFFFLIYCCLQASQLLPKNASSRHLLAFENCTPPAVDQFPRDLFTLESRRSGAVVLHIFAAIYMFIGLALVCDDYFVPACEKICDALKLSEDVAGATIMAAGSSAPELATAMIGIFVAKDDIGLGSVIGSAVFNIMLVISLCALFAGMTVYLKWWPMCRDCLCYMLSIFVLVLIIMDELVHWYEAMAMMVLYVLYIILMYFNPRIERYLQAYLQRKKNIKTLLCDKVGDNDDDSCNHEDESVKDDKNMKSKDVENGIIKKNGMEKSAHLKGEENGALLGDHKTNHINKNNVNKSKNKNSNNINNMNHDNHKSKKSNKIKIITGKKNDGELLIYDGISSSDDDDDDENEDDDYQLEKRGGIGLKSLKKEKVNSSNDDDDEDDDDRVKNENGDDEDVSVWNIPESNFKKAFWFFCLPLTTLMFLTVPDCRTPRWSRWYVATFLLSCVWISSYSYLMMWMITVTGYTFGIPDSVMGLTLIAAGSSVPDAIASLIVVRAGQGDMAVSNAIGSNIFDILVCLGLPWFLHTTLIQPLSPVPVFSAGLTYTALALLTTVFILLFFTHLNRWRLTKTYGATLLFFYLLFNVIASLFELNVFGSFNPPQCSSVYNLL